MIDETEIHRMANSADIEDRKIAIGQICDDFAYFSDKDTAWSDLHQLTQDEDNDVRGNAAEALGSCFSAVADKYTAWSDLHRLTQDEDSGVRGGAAYALGSCFFAVPDKVTAWSDLHRLTQDEDSGVRGGAAYALGSCFFAVPDKTTAWSGLHQLTQDEDNDVRRNAAYALSSCFSAVPDRNAVWSDLIQLTQDEDSDVRWNALRELGSCFSAVPDKYTAWSDLHRLTQDEDSDVRGKVASVLGSVFSAVPDKATAWSDLHRLTQDKDSDVRMYADHSLGSASVYKATETRGEDKFRDELKKAIDYFEQASNEAEDKYDDPARFCLPFYRSYYAVISETYEAETEAAKYLAEAKKATGGSESKEALIEAVENLVNALKEVQKPLDFGETKEHLRACKQHCDNTVELADSAKVESPMASAAIMRGIPIVGVKVKKVLAEIQKTAREACKQAKGTPAEEIACVVNKEVQKWVISDQDKMAQNVDNFVFCLKSTVPKTPQNQHIHEKIKNIKDEDDIIKQYAMVCNLIALIPKAEALYKQTKGTPFEDLGKEVNAKGKELLRNKEQPKIVGQKMSSFIISLSALCAKFSPENAEDTCKLLKKANETENLDDTIELLDEAMGKMLSQSNKERIPQTPVHESKPINQAIQPNSRQYITNENHINIVHLSDIHLGTESEALKYLTQLEADLVNNLEVKNIKYLVISGDVANFSRKYEYSAAVGLINGLIERFEIDKSRIIIVPGNHDLNWDFSRKAYNFVYKGGEEFPDPLPDGKYIPGGDEGVLLQDEDLYQKRFVNFNLHLYEKVLGTQYPLDYAEQGILHQCPEDQILFLALNSCWEIDHHKPHHERASININSLSSALGKLMDGEYKDWLKIAVWHHPVTGPEMMKNVEFLEQLAVHKFQICMHGHIHEASEDFYKYDDKRGMYIVGAGTFGAPKREQTKSIPLQYNLLTLDQENKKITINTRKKEKPDGAWSADPRWVDKDNPQPWYEIELK